MAGLNNLVVELSPLQGRELEARLRAAGYELRPVDHAVFGARGEDVNVVLYRSGKLVVQGRGVADFRLQHLEAVCGRPAPRLEAATIGADETGKGDYFGPLVAVACLLTPELEAFLDEVPLQDSKTLSDARVRAAAEALRPVVEHESVVIGPRRYNELYGELGNLNRLLAWAHAKAITALVARTGCKNVLVDQFAEPEVLIRALGRTALDVELTVRPRAEDDPAVAAASILARDAFLTGLDRLKHTAGRPLPKGAGEPVLKAGRALIQEKGREILAEVAKLHFKTTADLLR